MGVFDRLKGAGRKPAEPPRTPAQPSPAQTVPEADSKYLDRYYRSLERFEKAKDKRAFDEALQIALDTCEHLGEFVDAWRVQELEIHEGRLPPDWFGINSIPAVEFICRLAPARRDGSLLEEVEASLMQRPELSRWIPEVGAARGRLEVAERVFKAITEAPGTKQAGLAKSLGVDGNEVRNILYWAELRLTAGLCEPSPARRTSCGSPGKNQPRQHPLTLRPRTALPVPLVSAERAPSARCPYLPSPAWPTR